MPPSIPESIPLDLDAIRTAIRTEPREATEQLSIAETRDFVARVRAVDRDGTKPSASTPWGLYNELLEQEADKVISQKSMDAMSPVPL